MVNSFSGVTVKVFIADVDGDTIVEPPSSVRAYLVQTVEEFKALLQEVILLLSNHYCPAFLLCNGHRPIHLE
jgi:hypothetical protein